VFDRLKQAGLVVEQEERRILRIDQSFAAAAGEKEWHDSVPFLVAFRSPDTTPFIRCVRADAQSLYWQPAAQSKCRRLPQKLPRRRNAVHSASAQRGCLILFALIGRGVLL